MKNHRNSEASLITVKIRCNNGVFPNFMPIRNLGLIKPKYFLFNIINVIRLEMLEVTYNFNL